MGYIYLITNKLDGKQYVGQTSRDIHTRFAEHCTEKRGHSRLHNAIQKYGWQNFSIEELEQVPNDKLDEREIYWIKKLDTYNNGYNLTTGGTSININMAHVKSVRVKENNLIIFSKEELARLLSETTSWSMRYLSFLLARAINEGRDFLGYHLEYIELPSEDYLSDEGEIINWAKTLAVRFQGKHIYCPELDKHFDTISDAARYLLDNGLYKTTSRTPVQSVVTSISKCLREKTTCINGVNQTYTFIYMPGTTKNGSWSVVPFTKVKIYCPQIDKTFDSQIEAARYMLSSGLWSGIKEKTAKLRISDVINGTFPDYKGYTFVKVEG